MNKIGRKKMVIYLLIILILLLAVFFLTIFNNKNQADTVIPAQNTSSGVSATPANIPANTYIDTKAVAITTVNKDNIIKMAVATPIANVKPKVNVIKGKGYVLVVVPSAESGGATDGAYCYLYRNTKTGYEKIVDFDVEEPFDNYFVSVISKQTSLSYGEFSWLLNFPGVFTSESQSLNIKE